MAEKVLVTGGAGYIGSHLSYYLCIMGYDVVVIDDLSTGIRKNVSHQQIDFFEGDVGNKKLVKKILKNNNITSVFHTAAKTSVPESVSNPSDYYRENVSSSIALIESCLEEGVENFIFSSSAAVYGEPDVPTESIRESDKCNPINPYGKSKLMVENILKDVSEANENFQYASLRYFNVSGQHHSGQVKKPENSTKHLIDIACEAAINKGSISIYGTDYYTRDGTCLRDYIHVKDIAKINMKIGQKLRDDSVNQDFVLNCGRGEGHTVQEIINEVKRWSDNDFSVLEGSRREGDPSRLLADCTNMKKVLDDMHLDNIHTIVRTTLDSKK